MAECRLVAAAENDGDRVAVQVRREDVPEGGLVGLKIAGRRQIAEVGGMAKQVGESLELLRVWREFVKGLADCGRPFGGAGSAAVAADAFVNREADDDDAGRGRSGSCSEQVAEPRVVGVGIRRCDSDGAEHHCTFPPIYVARTESGR